MHPSKASKSWCGANWQQPPKVPAISRNFPFAGPRDFFRPRLAWFAHSEDQRLRLEGNSQLDLLVIHDRSRGGAFAGPASSQSVGRRSRDVTVSSPYRHRILLGRDPSGDPSFCRIASDCQVPEKRRKQDRGLSEAEKRGWRRRTRREALVRAVISEVVWIVVLRTTRGTWIDCTRHLSNEELSHGGLPLFRWKRARVQPESARPADKRSNISDRSLSLSLSFSYIVPPQSVPFLSVGLSLSGIPTHWYVTLSFPF